MSIVLNINGQPAVRMNAEFVRKTDKAVLLNCEGDEEWFPLANVRNNNDGTWDVQEWLYDKKFNSDDDK